MNKIYFTYIARTASKKGPTVSYYNGVHEVSLKPGEFISADILLSAMKDLKKNLSTFHNEEVLIESFSRIC